MRLDLGSIAINLRGSAWRLHVPVFYGRVMVIVDRSIDPIRGRRGAPCNVLDQIDDLPDRLRLALSDSELDDVWSAFQLALDAFAEMSYASFSDLVLAAFSDHEATISHIMAEPPHYGQAKWSALQAAEKSIKALIMQAGSDPPRIHDLARCARLADIEQALEADLLATIQCTGQIRYEPSRTSLKEAVAAHHASLRVSKACAIALRKRRGAA
jgi:hypothetical protein